MRIFKRIKADKIAAVTKKYGKKALSLLARFFKLAGGIFSRAWKKIWGLLCSNKHFARFVYVTFPSKRDRAIAFLKNNRVISFIWKKRYRIAVPLAVFIAALAVITGVGVKDAANSDYYPDGNPDVKYGMRIFTYSTFDHSDEKHGSIKLSWEDGVVDLTGEVTSIRIKADVNPINLNDTEVEWSVSDGEYATIDSEGRIEAKAPGRVRIYANLVNYGVTAEAKLFIRRPVSGIILPTSTITLYQGGSARYLSARLFPSDATNKTVTWHSKNPKIATVDQNGTVKPVSTGMTEITAVTEDGGYEGKCFVTVVNPSVDVSSLTLQNSEDMSISEGESINAIITVSPSNARNTTLKWSSDDESVATVSQTGRIRGVSAGVAYITAESVNGIRQTFEVEVYGSEDADSASSGYDYPSDGSVVYTPYSKTFPEAVEMQMSQNPPPKVWTVGGGVNATEAQTAEYMNPNNYFEDSYKYQFLDLAMPNGVSEESLDAYLWNKGILRGHGTDFIRAANEYGISEIYLVAHACLETGNGSSQLACGQEINGVTVYNMFGIGAYDGSALSSGALRAYREGWTSVEDAIMGGAKWISEHYINSALARQNTLYKMLWNPERPGNHQYATDIAWAVKQAVNIGNILSEIDGAALAYDIPVYNGMIPPSIITN